MNTVIFDECRFVAIISEVANFYENPSFLQAISFTDDE